ncbi:MAG: hydroxylamine reductase [Sulfurovum sp.]|nr:hydroxylamine reductase [Sulfurovum sp.]
MFDIFSGKKENHTDKAIDMFCYQCEMSMTGGCGSGGQDIGTCGKTAVESRLQDLIVFGVKGLAAYRVHARELVDENLKEDMDRLLNIDDVISQSMYFTLTNVNFNFDEHIAQLMKLGEAGVEVLDLLSDVHTRHFGIPTPVKISQNKAEGHAILVSGHDLDMLDGLLRRIKERGLEDKINVYTHSEMLPAHGYPHLREYPNLKGNIGKAWFDQTDLFSKWQGAIVVNTNCIVPRDKSSKVDSYIDRIYTYGIVGIEGAKKIEHDNYDELIDHALQLPEVNGFESNETLTTGHHYKTILTLAPQILEAVSEGKITKFFVIAGCDAPGKGGEYYREMAEALPESAVIITSSCGKFRFNDIDFGNIPGTQIPRYLDLGQCNDSNGAVHIAVAVANALGVKDLNDLPVEIVLSWMEQKAVIILLALFSLGIKNIYLGPKAPQFLNSDIANFLIETFNIHVIDNPKEPRVQAREDLETLLA